MNKQPSVSEVLERRVAEVLPSKEGLAKLMKAKKIRLYLGVDPTSPNLHLGHAVVLRKLRQFQDLGHEVILLFGTFTAQIGDPSGRDSLRKPLTLEEIKANIAEYRRQAGKILNIKTVVVKQNGTWLSKLSFQDIVHLASNFTVTHLLERDMFQKRMKGGGEVWMHELLYPLMQGYDSVAMDVDLEIGGTDQLFNILVGRRLQKAYHNKEKFALTVPLLLGPDGRKMSKSYGNVINLVDTPEDMYGKVMSLNDDLIPHYFELATDVPAKEVKEIQDRVEKGLLLAKDAKARLAQEIVAWLHGPVKAKKAEEEFSRVFQRKELPSNMPTASVSQQKISAQELLVVTKLASSKNNARRVIEQGGVKVDGIVLKDWKQEVSPRSGMVIQVGKRNFLRIR